MEQRSESRPAARGLTVTQLTFVFIAGVAVCAIFFTLGFLVGANERNVNSNAPTVERVAPPGDVPPPVNGPLNSSAASASGGAAAPAASSGQVQEENLPPSGSAVTAAGAAPITATMPASTSTGAAGKTTMPAVPAPSANSAAPGPGSGMVVQVAALHSEKDATSLVATLRSQRYPAFLVTPEQAGMDDGIYRVQIGPYPTRAAAETVKDRLLKEGFNPFIK